MSKPETWLALGRFHHSESWIHSSFVIRHLSFHVAMTLWTLIFRSLRFHARSHLGALLGAAVGSAVLLGALVVGDSVRGSLRDMALARLGRVQLALEGKDRFVRADLAGALTDKGLGRVVP